MLLDGLNLSDSNLSDSIVFEHDIGLEITQKEEKKEAAREKIS